MKRTFSHHLILSFLTVFILLPACTDTVKAPASAVAPPSAEKTCMDKIIASDEVLGKTRNHACEKIPLAKTIRHYADGMEKLDFSGCPKAFAEGFKKHIAAWQAMIPLMEKYPDVRGEMHDLFDAFEKGEDAEMFKPLLKAIWDTWGEVETAMKE